MSRTPLYDKHIAAGGRVIDFAGWDMPVQYTSILDEHKAVRTACGVFDISHMGEFFVRGAGVAAWLDFLLTNRVVALEAGQSQYSLMLNERGGVIDDLIVYRIKEMEFLIVVNASKIEEDAAWLQAHLTEGIVFEDRSDDFAALAVQGPDAPKVFEACFGRPLPAERNRVIEIGSNFVVTTGYTGEVGFEIISPAAEVGALWDGFLAAGVKPCGLGARDTLRLEMCYPLNGSDLSLEHTPLEAGLGFFVNLEKGEFIGREILANQRAAGLSQRLVAIKMDEKSPPIRSHYPVLAEGQKVAETTSGALSPSLGYGIAMAYLPFALAKVGQPLEIQVRDRSYKASVVKKPFYQAK
ncbi:glycine cleavage system aminomethyltransferase GcvT [soil metagenome]